MLTGTAHFSVAEAVQASGGAIPSEIADNAQAVLEWLEAARVYLGRPIIITSLYRSPAANASTSGAASDSQHLRALAADFDVLGLTNHAALQAIEAGIADGSIPQAHQLITYTTDHHLHVGIAGEQWAPDGIVLLETSVGQYAALSSDQLAELAQTSIAHSAVNMVAQASDVVSAHPVAGAALLLLFAVPALMGGHWT